MEADGSRPGRTSIRCIQPRPPDLIVKGCGFTFMRWCRPDDVIDLYNATPETMDETEKAKQKLIHIRNVAKVGRGWSASTARDLLQQFERLYTLGASLDDLMAIARQRLGYDGLWNTLRSLEEELSAYV